RGDPRPARRVTGGDTAGPGGHDRMRLGGVRARGRAPRLGRSAGGGGHRGGVPPRVPARGPGGRGTAGGRPLSAGRCRGSGTRRRRGAGGAGGARTGHGAGGSGVSERGPVIYPAGGSAWPEGGPWM